MKMNKTSLAERVSRARQELDRLGGDLTALERSDPIRYPENFGEMAVEAATRAERVTCSLRQLVYSGLGAKKAEYLSNAASAQGVEISRNSDCLTVSVPALLPHRKKGSSEFLVDPVFFALSEYAMASRFPRLAHAVVCFVHVYEEEGCVRDYDNIESKQLLDVVAMFALQDDNGQFCDVYHTTARGPKARTEVYIMPPEAFPGWLESRKTAAFDP